MLYSTNGSPRFPKSLLLANSELSSSTPQNKNSKLALYKYATHTEYLNNLYVYKTYTPDPITPLVQPISYPTTAPWIPQPSHPRLPHHKSHYPHKHYSLHPAARYPCRSPTISRRHSMGKISRHRAPNPTKAEGFRMDPFPQNPNFHTTCPSKNHLPIQKSPKPRHRIQIQMHDQRRLHDTRHTL